MVFREVVNRVCLAPVCTRHPGPGPGWVRYLSADESESEFPGGGWIRITRMFALLISFPAFPLSFSPHTMHYQSCDCLPDIAGVNSSDDFFEWYT